MEGIQSDLIKLLGKYSPIPVTYAGGVKALSDLDLVKEIGQNRVDLTIGSALDIFGGSIPYRSVVDWFGQIRC
jgi:phosphoribosylformimino-5-aminoimidazole carboxamide ribotide isomerase